MIYFSDLESGVSRSDFALGVTPRDTYILNWQVFPYKDFMEVNFKIPDGVPAWVRIRCLNKGKVFLKCIFPMLIIKRRQIAAWHSG